MNYYVYNIIENAQIDATDSFLIWDNKVYIILDHCKIKEIDYYRVLLNSGKVEYFNTRDGDKEKIQKIKSEFCLLISSLMDIRSTNVELRESVVEKFKKYL